GDFPIIYLLVSARFSGTKVQKIVDTDKKNRIYFIRFLRVVTYLRSDYDKALEYISKAYEIAETIGEVPLKAILLNRLGRTYAMMTDAETARAKFQAAIELLPEDDPEAIDSRERLNKL
ncbi:MAG: tetratricopeptide repeat protein, partial [Paludibacteraceae bacterium]|nr:tetratricopeptide repeat protein [Paludibacteraceae bacterium]